MANIITVRKPKEYDGSFISIDKKAYAKFVSKTQKKNVIVLYTFLAGNKDGFSVTVTKDRCIGLFGASEGLTESIVRKENVDELRKLGYINENDEFNEYGWDNVEKKEESISAEKPFTFNFQKTVKTTELLNRQF